jgi:N-acetylglutamate synthase-like GNAT family acetyltransferase
MPVARPYRHQWPPGGGGSGRPDAPQYRPLPAAASRPPFQIRQAESADREALAEMLSRCTESTRWRRFLGPLRSFPEPYLTDALSGHTEHFALVAAAPAAVVALASCHTAAGDAAELAVLVEDAWQQHGLGTCLLHRLLDHSDRRGFRMLKATVLADQAWIVRALSRYGTCAAKATMGVYQVTLLRDPRERSCPASGCDDLEMI